MAIGRISGSVLKSNLTRNGVDLAFETNLLYLDVTNSRVGIGTSEPNTALHVVGNTTITGDLSVSGNVSFEIGSINSLNTGALIVDDNNITGTRSNEDIIVSAAGTGKIVLKNTLVANTLQSDDSTAIQINDGVNISGTLNAKNFITTTISTEDSSAITVNAGLNLSSHDLTAAYLYGDGRYLTGLAPALQNYQFTGTAADVGTYYQAENLAAYVQGSVASTTVSVTTTPTLMASFITNTGYPNITVIPTGKVQILYETQKSTGVSPYVTYAEVYKRNTGGTETLLFTSDVSSTLTVNSLVQQDVSYFVGSPIDMGLTDRLVVKIYAQLLSGAAANITLRWDDATSAGIVIPTVPASAVNFVPYQNATADVNLGSYGLKSSTVTTNSISSDDSTAIQINDGLNVSGTLTASGLVANGITYPASDGTANQVLVTNGAGQLSFTSLSSFTGITFVGDDSTGTTLNTGETIKIAGTQNITTAVSGDTLTITGPDLSSYATQSYVTSQGYITNSSIIVVGDDSTGTTLNTGETIKFAGTQNITTAISGDTLTITGPDLSSYATQSYVTSQGYITNSPITIVGDDSTGTTFDTGETFKITGATGITTAVSGDTLTVTGPDLTNYAQKTDTAITLVGDDSTGTAVTFGETFKIAGGANITTAVSGDTVTISGSNPAQGITFIGDDSTGTAIADGGTLQIVGAGSVDTSISGNVLTITGTSSIDSLNTGGLLIDDNKIAGQRSNEDIEISTSGTGVITVDTSIIPTIDDVVDLGSLTKRFKTGYFGSGTVYIGDQTISSSKTGLIFSGRVNMPSSMLDKNAKIISKIGIDTSEKTIDSFSVSETRSALYYQVYRDEVHDEVIASKISIVHDGLEGFISESAVVGTGTFVSGEGHTSSASVIGDNLLYKITGDSAINSVQSYKISLRDNTGLKSIGRTSTLRYENLSTAETVIDTWDIDEYRSAKYFISVSDEGAQISNDYLNAEVCMVHDGTDAYVTTYNILSSSDESFITFTADVSDGVARLKAYSTGGTLNLKLHKLLLSDDESSDETHFQKIIGTVTASSAETTVDSFHITDATAAFYTISAHDSNNTQSSISEVIVIHDEANPYVVVGPQLTTDGIIHLTFSVEILGNQVYLKAAGSEAEIKISGYKVSLHRPPAGNSNASLSAQGITIVGDDSSGTRIADNETVKIAGGAGITTSMVGDTLTITATGSAEATAEGLTFVGDDSTGTRISDGETVKITGAGGITTAMSGDTLTITGPTAFTFSVAGDDSTQRAISTGNTIKFVGSNGITTATDAEGNVTISGTTLVTLNIDAAGSAVVYDIAALNLDGGSAASTYGAGETSVNGGGA